MSDPATLRRPDRPRVVVIGGGFGGLYAAQSLRNAPVDVILLDRRNFHLFQPLLYQVATGGLSPANIAAPLRSILSRQKNATVLLAEVRGVDGPGRRLHLADGAELSYDALIVATGASHNYFGNDHWEQLAPGLKTIEDATEIRGRILSAFETAEREGDPEREKACMTFVVVGAGPTGVELAGALAEIARDTLRKEFRRINTSNASVLLVEAGERILSAYPPELSERASESLRALGVTVRTRCAVTDVQPDGVSLQCGKSTERIATRTVLWAAGVAASPLGKALAESCGAKLDRAGRVFVGPDLTVPGHPEIFVIGDLAHFEQDGAPVPAVATTAMQQGRYAARLIHARIAGGKLPPFRYKHPGSMATIGRAAAVADLGPRLRFSGYLAWLVWLFVHLINIVEFQNRVLVLLQWAWNYFTYNRSARLITGIEQRTYRG